MEGSRSTLSPNVYGNGGPFAIAEATADFRKSMTLEALVCSGGARSVARRRRGLARWMEGVLLRVCL